MIKKFPFIFEIMISIIFIMIGLFFIKTGYYSTFFCSLSFGLMLASFIQLFKIWYYEMPANKEKFKNIKKENYINSVDERKIYLRLKAGSLTYQIMTFVLLFLSFILSLFHVEVWIIATIFGLFILQILFSIIV